MASPMSLPLLGAGLRRALGRLHGASTGFHTCRVLCDLYALSRVVLRPPLEGDVSALRHVCSLSVFAGRWLAGQLHKARQRGLFHPACPIRISVLASRAPGTCTQLTVLSGFPSLTPCVVVSFACKRIVSRSQQVVNRSCEAPSVSRGSRPVRTHRAEPVPVPRDTGLMTDRSRPGPGSRRRCDSGRDRC